MPLCVSSPAGFGVATYPAGATFGPRQMRDWEFVWIIAGHAMYRHGEIEIAAPPDSIVLCRPGANDGFVWDAHGRTRHAYFHFDITSLPDAWPSPETWPLVRLMPEGDVLRPLFRHLLTWAGRGDGELVRLTIAHMVAAWATGEIATRDVPPESLPEPVGRALIWLRERLEEKPAASIELRDLAGAACVSPEHLCRVFKEATGHAPMETVRLARLDRAATLLARSNYSIGEVARLCGFASPFHFSRQFKSAFDQSPSALRRALQEGQTPPVPRLLKYFERPL